LEIGKVDEFAAVGLCFVLAILIGIFVAMQRRNSSVTPLRPISDEEFVRLCGPGTNPDVALRVRRVVARVLGLESKYMRPTDRFVEDYGAD
jgi:hypothetical protein